MAVQFNGMIGIIYFLKLPWLLLLTLWRHGVPATLAMMYDVVVRRRLAPGIRFPHESPSNAAAYLPLLRIRPLISIIMPVYNSHWLAQAADTVLKQSYDNLELILVDDCSTDPLTLSDLRQLAQHEKVILLKTANNLGISGATNQGLARARGEYVGFMDHDDLLHPDALALLVRALNRGASADVFFTDEARMDQRGFVNALMRKSRPSMDLLLACNAVLHFCVISRRALDRLGPLNSDYDGSQDHDLMLRAMEHGLRFHHLPYLLYAWRIHDASASADMRREADGKARLPQAYRSGKRMVNDYLARHKIAATVTDDGFPWYRVKYNLPPSLPPVAVIIPFKDGLPDLRRLMQSLRRTTWPDYHLHLVDNRSGRPSTGEYLRALDPTRCTVHAFDEPFNFSRLHNQIVGRIECETIIFLNNDAEIINPDWIECLYEHLQRERVAAVGCRLLRSDGSIQHAGITFQPSILSCATNITAPDHFVFVQREVAGVTAACMMIRRSAFLEIGGFDEIDFPIGFSDADLCLRLRRAGYKIIYTPFARLYHHESRSRRAQEENHEKYTMFSRYTGPSLMTDPHYHTMVSPCK